MNTLMLILSFKLYQQSKLILMITYISKSCTGGTAVECVYIYIWWNGLMLCKSYNTVLFKPVVVADCCKCNFLGLLICSQRTKLK